MSSQHASLVVYLRFPTPYSVLQNANPTSRSLLSLPTTSDDYTASGHTKCGVDWVKWSHIYRFLRALLHLCDCQHFIRCPGCALIGPFRSRHFTRFSSWRLFLNPDCSSWLAGPGHDMAFSVCISVLLPSHHATMSADRCWPMGWWCLSVIFRSAVWQDRVASRLVYGSQFVWHGPASCNHRYPMKWLFHTQAQSQLYCHYLTSLSHKLVWYVSD